MKRILEVSLIVLFFMAASWGVFFFSPSPCSASISIACGESCYDNADCSTAFDVDNPCTICVFTGSEDTGGNKVGKCE